VDFELKLDVAVNPLASRPKILAVDDREENLLSLRRLMSGLEAELVTVTSGHQALAQILRHEFALILLDVMMPDMDGFETASLIRGHDAGRHTPIIFVTAADRDHFYEDKGYDLGAVDYLFKPLHPHILMSKVRVFLDLARHQQMLVESLNAVRQLRDSNELILRSVGEGILSLDLQRRITFANPTASRLLGVEQGRSTGKCLSEFIVSTSGDQTESHWLSGDVYSEVDVIKRQNTGLLTFRNSGGRQFPIEYNASPIVSACGSVTGFAVIFQDISERKEREALELASKYKSAFLANVSHELRSPLNSLLILAGNLAANKEGNLSDDQVKAATVIRQEGRDLLRVIDDILDLTKVEAGKMTMHWGAVQIQDVVGHLQSQFLPVAAQKDLEFDVNVCEMLPATVHTDRGRLLQVLKNLLANSFKFTNAGTVTLNIHASGDADNSTIVFTISDTGIGIDPEYHTVIFEPFQQVDEKINRQYDGTGLGLAICRQLASLLGGQVTVKSQLGQGSSFALVLPIQPVQNDALVDGRVMASVAVGEKLDFVVDSSAPKKSIRAGTAEFSQELAMLAAGKVLLLVDGNMRSAFMLAALLRSHGFTVIKAESCEAAKNRLRAISQVDVIWIAEDIEPASTDDFFSVLYEHYDNSGARGCVLAHPKVLEGVARELSTCVCRRAPVPLDNTHLLTTLVELLTGCEEIKVSIGERAL
jgi:PAS domain S-box-containing protein